MKRSNKPSSALSRAPTRGFTLVELIVVIAILGILAGIAIPVYSNYINKANEAADQQLIGAVNTAFAAACLEHGVDAKNVTGAELAYTTAEDDKTYITGLESVNGLDLTQMNESFTKFFGDNDQTALRYYKEGDITFNPSPDPQAGTFSAGKGTGEGTTGGILDATYTWHDFEDAAAAYQISNFKNMGVEGVTGTVDNLAGALSDYPQLFRVVQTGLFAETLDKLGIDLETASNDTKANAAVFFVADQVSRMDTSAVLEALQNEALNEGGSGLDAYMATLGITGDDAIFLGTAIRYGVATAYAYSDWGDAEDKAAFLNTTPTSRTQAVALIQDVITNPDSEYMAYIFDTIEDADTGSLEDTNAFFGILKAVSENTEGFADISSGRLFSNEEVVAKIKELLGDA